MVALARSVNLYELRRAVAALVYARHHIDDLTGAELVCVDGAVGWLACRRGDLDGDLAAATRSLLSADRDDGGPRTVQAIETLARLVNVDPDSAKVLSSLPADDTDVGPLRLFDPDPTSRR